VDGGERAGKPSTIADVSSGTLIIIREGAYSLPELIAAATGNLDNRPEKV
jgi:tRNA A37 threonylcarbamoyladenosine synthetase subunit TsaC/SUA5/YrdC